MKHSINLFQADLIPERPWLTLHRILLAVALIIVVILLFRAHAAVQLSQLNAELQQHTAERAQAQQQISELSREVSALRPDLNVQSRLLEYEAEIQTRQQLIGEFQRRSQIRRHHYAGLLTDLARLHLEGIWLTRIQQQDGQILLHGKTLNAGLLPLWMQSFAQSDVLSQRQFNMVELKRDERELLSFVLRGSMRSQQQVEIPADEVGENGGTTGSGGDE